MYYTNIQNAFKEFNNDIEDIKKEIEEYFKINYEGNINLNYDVIEVCEGKFFACVDDNNTVKFNLKFINEGYTCLFNKISTINPENPMILEYVIKILLYLIISYTLTYTFKNLILK